MKRIASALALTTVLFLTSAPASSAQQLYYFDANGQLQPYQTTVQPTRQTDRAQPSYSYTQQPTYVQPTYVTQPSYTQRSPYLTQPAYIPSQNYMRTNVSRRTINPDPIGMGLADYVFKGRCGGGIIFPSLIGGSNPLHVCVL